MGFSLIRVDKRGRPSLRSRIATSKKADFMFQLSAQEFNDLKSQSVMASGQHGGRRTRPLVFAEQGVAMLSGVLHSERAAAVNVEIMRAFVELRRAATSYAAIEKRLEELERETGAKLGQHDEQLSQIFKALRQLISPPPRPKRRVGFGLPRRPIAHCLTRFYLDVDE